MTVAELIAKLQTMPQDLVVAVNDVDAGNWFEDLEVFAVEADEEYGDDACCMICVNQE